MSRRAHGIASLFLAMTLQKTERELFGKQAMGLGSLPALSRPPRKKKEPVICKKDHEYIDSLSKPERKRAIK